MVKGERHPAWKGDAATVTTKRERAQRAFALGACERCGGKAVDRHHRDGDPGNNAPGNVAPLCRRCHMIEDGRLAAFMDRLRRPRPIKLRTCEVCGRVEPSKRGGRGRCHRCHVYLLRTGRDRPTDASGGRRR